MQQFRCLQWIFIAHLDQIFFFNPQFTLVNGHISGSKTLPLRNWQVRNGLYSAWEKEKLRRFNTITHFTNARSVHSGFYKRKTMDDDQKKFFPQLAIDKKNHRASPFNEDLSNGPNFGSSSLNSTFKHIFYKCTKLSMCSHCLNFSKTFLNF